MDFAEYKAIQAISATAIKAGAVSMKHMHAVMTEDERAETPAMRWGFLVHLAILEPESFIGRVAIFDGTKRGKAWDEFKTANDSLDIITADEHDRLMAISTAVRSNKAAGDLITNTLHELSVRANDATTGQAKARLDGFSPILGVVELKTTARIQPELFAKQFVGMGYDLQVGWYCDLARRHYELDAMPACHVIAIESKPPYDVAVYRVPDMVINVGKSKARKIAEAYRQAEKAGVFPGVMDGVKELVMPAWYGEKDVMEAFAEMSASALFGDEE